MMHREVLYADSDLQEAVRRLETVYRDREEIDGWILENAIKLWLQRMVTGQLEEIEWWTTGPYTPCCERWRTALAETVSQEIDEAEAR